MLEAEFISSIFMMTHLWAVIKVGGPPRLMLWALIVRLQLRWNVGIALSVDNFASA
jgi:hypothetical protein